MSRLSDAEWGYCCHCHREVEVRDGFLITHGQGALTGGCAGSGTKPTEAPPEGTTSVMTVPPERPAASVNTAAIPASTSAMRWTWAAFRGGRGSNDTT